MSSVLLEHLHWIIFLPLAWATWKFYSEFFKPSQRLGVELKQATEQLEMLKSSGNVLDLDGINKQVMVNSALSHGWSEYRDTLHGQKSANSIGMMEVSRWRATAMANMFFTEQTVVDVPLKAEFYKHLPGILTGLGIIGTFTGLILGLSGFKVSTDAAVAQQSLQGLLGSVGGAFIVSGTAIALAMFATWLEKSTLNKRYSELENFCALVDGLFDAGAGEEYLQRLVEASETSATQAMQMKESLVTDLKQVLTELTQQQIATMTATSQQLSHSITTSLSEGLTEPLTRISSAVATVGQSQGDAVNKMLTDVLGSFAEKMESMFGSQLRGMNEMLAETAGTIRTTSDRFEQLAAQIQQAGSGAADAMAQKMGAALENMQARQMEANEQMRLFVDQLKENLSKGQTESTERTLQMMKELGDTTRHLVEQLQAQAQNADQSHAQRQQERDEQMRQLMEGLKASMADSQSQTSGATSKLLQQLGETTTQLLSSMQERTHNADQSHAQRQQERDEQMRQLMEGLKASMAQGQSDTAAATSKLLQQLGDTSGQLLSTIQEKTQQAERSHAAQQEAMAKQVTDLLDKQQIQISRLSDTVQAASTAMKESVTQLLSSTSSNVERMGQGADRLNSAANVLTTNLGQIKTVTDGMGTNVDKLNQTASGLNAALAAAQQVLLDQKSVRDTLSAMVNDLRATVENAKREAGLTSELVNSLKSASQKLVEAQQTADHYLESVTDVMANSHAEFAKQIRNTLREGNSAFHTELAQATSYLKGAIQDLGDHLDNLPTRR
ncbi:anti-phage ZorAB system protein ZorA [Malikia sp.]|uniref:anti-phage ZorAB system protein ZorA n=1 Tax=Malikia sp. TaxID=2070706 RepID=UPI0026040A64|nr:anti-phage ZorAB system protein ZorA [Malikia sp.]